MASSETARPDTDRLRRVLCSGRAIPAHPLALDSNRRLDERRQRALSRYYLDSGAGGLAVGVHTTQFAIRNPKVGLFEPVLSLAREEMDRFVASGGAPPVRIGGIVGPTVQAISEANCLRALGYDAGLLSLAGFGDANDDTLISHCQRVSETIPLVGFYLQPSVGGLVLGYGFWRRFLEIPDVIAVKIAPFDRYKTLAVVRALADSGRDDIALYTGNDDQILLDLLTPFSFSGRTIRIVGGLLGHWSAWTKPSVAIFHACRALAESGAPIPAEWLTRAAEVTDANAAFFDAANEFSGCIAGMHEVLRRSGLLAGIWCLDPGETLSAGQSDEIDRVWRAYPQLRDDEFVAENLDRWLSG